jgi:hypothetical protein
MSIKLRKRIERERSRSLVDWSRQDGGAGNVPSSSGV